MDVFVGYTLAAIVLIGGIYVLWRRRQKNKQARADQGGSSGSGGRGGGDGRHPLP